MSLFPRDIILNEFEGFIKIYGEMFLYGHKMLKRICDVNIALMKKCNFDSVILSLFSTQHRELLK